MLGRLIGLLAAAGFAAIAVLLRDPTVFGPGAPAVPLGELELFRPPLVLAAGLLAVCGLLAAVQPRGRKAKAVAAAPFVLAMPDEPGAEVEVAADEEPEPTTSETRFQSEPGAFSLGASPSASPLW